MGTGVDIVSIPRMKEACSKEAFLRRVFTDAEIEYARSRRRPERHLAGRFAAKEAFVKALGRGILSGMGLKEIEVVNGPLGRPGIRLTEAAASMTSGAPVHLSISYAGEFAIAAVVVG